MFEKRFIRQLTSQRQAGLYRNPPQISRREGKYVFLGDRKVLNFSSNDYLGLSTSKELRKSFARNIIKYGTSSSSSRLVSANYSLIGQAEREYARYFGYEDAVFFPSGYQANYGVLSTLFKPHDKIIFDKHIHASSVKGIAASGADFYGYRHSSIDHLRKRLETFGSDQAAVVTESLFSMDGDLLDVGVFSELKQRFGFFSIIDEAHSFGAIGEKGRGVARKAADVAVGTFGKALGLFGAFILLSGYLKEYLFNFASPLIYTTTLPAAHAATAMDLLELIEQGDDRRKKLRLASHFMKESLTREGFAINGDAHILALHIGQEDKAVKVSCKLMENGIFAFPARYPTVSINKAILRIGLCAEHTEEDVNFFVETLKRVFREFEQ
jgi:8-amino-7-oxononanoate synthase